MSEPAPSPNPRELRKGTTPGPWIVDRDPKHKIEVLGGSPPVVPVVFLPDNKVCLANARLIAAAPDLARRLEEAEGSTVRGFVAWVERRSEPDAHFAVVIPFGTEEECFLFAERTGLKGASSPEVQRASAALSKGGEG